MDPAMLLFAFVAGAAAFFAPCSAAMLPGYVAFAVRQGGAEGSAAMARPMPSLSLALVLGGAIPLATGISAFTISGFGGIYALPLWLWRLVPPFQASTVLLIGGASALFAGLVLAGRTRLALRGVAFASLATAGAFTTLLLIGLPIALLAEALLPYLWWGGAAVGALILFLGAATLAGGTLPTGLPNIVGHFAGPGGYFKFGLVYGIAGLTCTFPAFLAIVAAATVSGGAAEALAVFVAYAAGKGIVLGAITTSAVAGSASLSAAIGRHAPRITRASGLLLMTAGAYMIYYFASPTSPARVAGWPPT